MRRAAVVLAMLAFGAGVYVALGALGSKAPAGPITPSSTLAGIDVGGNIYVVQHGAIYKLSRGAFRRLNPGGPGGAWMQPALSADGSYLVAVNRSQQSSDLWLIDRGGHVVRQMTMDSGSRGIVAHWAFYPRFSPDETHVFYSFDSPKFAGDYHVDLAIWSLATNSNQRFAVRQSTFNDYTGGDTYPIPLADGGLVYAKYNIAAAAGGLQPQGPYAQLWYQARALSPGKALTVPQDDCSQPALAPDGKRLAMICTSGGQSARIEVADFSAGVMGSRRVLVIGIVGGSPVWSPDGRTIAYLASAGGQRHFQLWTISAPPSSATPTPSVPRQLTADLDFDATSAPAWGP